MEGMALQWPMSLQNCMMAHLNLMSGEPGKREETNYLLSKWQTQTKYVIAFVEHRNKKEKNMSKRADFH